MSFTYDNTDFTETAAGRRNSVRYLVGDTNTNDQLVQDEEIVFSLAQSNDNIYLAASHVANAIAAKFSRFVDTNVDEQIEEKYSQAVKHYKNLASQLKEQGKSIGALLGFCAGGITEEGIRRLPKFTLDQFLNEVNDEFTS